ncbi:PQQ-binding-like beta-propeller repeat protein [candidate division KSB1 bacterium]|nr:PQQ-binding-like beta-propeller repeat protein [candidate division KSB1 bacterium]
MNFELRKNKFYHVLFVLMLTLLFSGNIEAADWPQWRGINRDGKSPETGLLKKWPEGGPRLLWKLENPGGGYSSVSIAKGTIYLTSIEEKQGYLTAIDLKGNIKWKKNYGPAWTKSFPESRTAPTIDGNRIYLISGLGKVVCLDAATGAEIWAVDAFQKFKGEYHSWGIAESPLIVDNKVIATPGGKEATLVALDKVTGEIIWKTTSLNEMSSYCSPLLVERGGKKIIVTQLEKSFVGVDASDGKVLWTDPFDSYQDDPKAINPITPVYADGKIYITSGYDDGGALYELSADGTKITRKWIDTTLDTHHGGVVLVDGYLYGSNWLSNRKGNWVCLEWTTGKVIYDQEWHNKGPIIYADGMLYCYDEKDGNFGLVKANHQKFEVIRSFQVPFGSGPHWGHPVISDKRLYIRHGDALMVYDIAQ